MKYKYYNKKLLALASAGQQKIIWSLEGTGFIIYYEGIPNGISKKTTKKCGCIFGKNNKKIRV